RDVMKECGSAILIFTKDEKFLDADGNEVWRPSENVVYELGAASFEYGNRIVIFMEEGLNFPANFESIGHISFEEAGIEAKTAARPRELMGLGRGKVTPTGWSRGRGVPGPPQNAPRAILGAEGGLLRLRVRPRGARAHGRAER